MASQSFLASDPIIDAASSVDSSDLPPSDDFGIYVAGSIQTDTSTAPDDSSPRSHLVSLDVDNLFGNGMLNSHGTDGDAAGLVSLPLNATQAAASDALDTSSLGIAGLIQTALENGAGLVFVGSDNFAKGGPGSGSGSGGGGGSGIPNYISGDPGHYNIEIIFKGTWSTDLVNVFKSAADLLSDYITADIPDVLYRGKIIDDLSITAELTNIDGVGGILGQAGPTALRTGSYLPAAGSMQFDIADATTYQAQGLFDDIVLHEMMHTVGFGTIWSYKGLLTGAGGDNPLFTGSKALAAYQTLFSASGATGVPVEQDGGSGTRDSHWDEQTFNGELMTGYIGYKDSTGTVQLHDTLSYMSVASLGDLGYTLDSTMDAGNFVAPDWIS
jgi:Leishmanolysin